MEQNKKTGACLMDEDGIRIEDGVVTTPTGAYPLADIEAAELMTYKPLWGPFLLATLGTLNLVAAFQTGHVDIWLASAFMLGGGLVWRRRGTRHVLILETGGKKVNAWYTRNAAQRNRAVEIVRAAIDQAGRRESHRA
jgi:hypothetical protein